MLELTSEQETILAECLQSMEEGQGLEACLARYPEHAQALRPLLHLHSELLDFEPPDPAPFAYQSGRDALLARLADGPSIATPTMPGLRESLLGVGSKAEGIWARFSRAFRTPAAQGSAVALALIVFGGGALGASAAAGFEPSQAILSSLGVMDDHNDSAKTLVDDGEKDDKGGAEATKTNEPDKNTPVSVVAPGKSPTPEKPADDAHDPDPTDRPVDPEPTTRREHPRPTPTRVHVPVEPVDPTPIPIDLGGVCIPISVYEQSPALHAYDVTICGADQVASLNEMFAKGLCLPKEVADTYPFLVDLMIKPCGSEQEKAIEQYLFVKGWCAPDKAAKLLAEIGYSVPKCDAYKIKIVLLWLKDNEPCGLDWLVPPPGLVCK